MSYDDLCKILDFAKSNRKYVASEQTAQGKLLKDILDRDLDYEKDQEDTAVSALATRYSNARKLPKLKPTRTIPDPAVSVLMETLYKQGNTKSIDRHREAMAAENILGKLLEFYIAEKLESLGWVWCAGELIQAVDFVKAINNSWEMLQVKNRSNSENSSSKKIRLGTSIKHWYRIDAITGTTKWEDFPDDDANRLLSEAGFQEYLKKVSAVLLSEEN